MLRLLALGAGLIALLGVALVVIVVGAGIALVLGRSVAAVVRWLKRSALAVGVSGLGGIGGAVVASEFTPLDPGLIGLLTALFLFVVTLATLPMAGRAAGSTGVPRVGRRRERETRRAAERGAARPGAVDPLARAWDAAARRADWAQSRIAVARTSCERLLRLADERPLDTHAAEWAGVVRRRVPELVASCLQECDRATPAERETHLEHLVEALEKIGGEADRRRTRLLDQATPFGVQRTYVDQRTARDPLSPDP